MPRELSFGFAASIFGSFIVFRVSSMAATISRCRINSLENDLATILMISVVAAFFCKPLKSQS
ncbi:MAG: hypothetical protein DMG06_02915 [Acidobacteria bacterium]|nr:MAG: hypothetical protein DMG06_02915 [Acidobacteriota bacterium]